MKSSRCRGTQRSFARKYSLQIPAPAAQVNHTVRQYLVELEQQNPTERFLADHGQTGSSQCQLTLTGDSTH